MWHVTLIALVFDELLKHLNFSIKVAIVSCFSKIFRITTLDTPYGAETMYEIFPLIISSIYITLTNKLNYMLRELRYLRLWLV